MIRNKTVLVLGAGASAPYGFPLGVGLVDAITTGILEPSDSFGNDIRSTLLSGEPLDSLPNRLQKNGYKQDEVRRFAQELRKARPYSIDAFLETRNEFMEVGKASIADVLLRAEALSTIATADVDVDWYRYLFSKILLLQSKENYQRQASNLTVVTFNFDRSFERTLYSSLKATFGLNEIDARALTSAINIHHIHGLLGASKFLAPNHPESTPYGPSAPELGQATIIAARQIRIVHEDSRVVESAVKALSEATNVYFIGFGFDERNLLKIKVPECLSMQPPSRGTAYNMTTIEQHPVLRHFRAGRREINLFNVDAIGFIRGFAEALFD